MLVPNRLRVVNVRGVQEFETDFGKQVTVLLGAIGAGKTTIAQYAVEAALTGGVHKPGQKRTYPQEWLKPNPKRKDAGQTEIALEFLDTETDAPLRIKRSFAPHDLLVNASQRSSHTATQEWLYELLGDVTEEQVTALLQSSRFVGMTPTQASAFMLGLLNEDITEERVLDACGEKQHDLVRQAIDTAESTEEAENWARHEWLAEVLAQSETLRRQQHRTNQQYKEMYTQARGALEAIPLEERVVVSSPDNLIEKADEKGVEAARLEAVRGQRSLLAAEIKDAEEELGQIGDIADPDALMKQHDEAQAEAKRLQEEVAAKTQAAGLLDLLLQAARDNFERAQTATADKPCPVCGKPLTAKELAEHLVGLETALNEAEDAFTAAKQEQVVAGEALSVKQKEAMHLMNQAATAKTAAEEKAELESALADGKKTLEELEVIDDATIDKLREQMAELRQQADHAIKYQRAQNAIKEQKATLDEGNATYERWNMVVNKLRELQAKIVEESAKPLLTMANAVLQDVLNMRLLFSPADGLVVRDGSSNREFVDLSRGEEKIVMASLQAAFSMACGLGLAVIDDIGLIDPIRLTVLLENLADVGEKSGVKFIIGSTQVPGDYEALIAGASVEIIPIKDGQRTVMSDLDLLPMW